MSLVSGVLGRAVAPASRAGLRAGSRAGQSCRAAEPCTVALASNQHRADAARAGGVDGPAAGCLAWPLEPRGASRTDAGARRPGLEHPGRNPAPARRRAFRRVPGGRCAGPRRPGAGATLAQLCHWRRRELWGATPGETGLGEQLRGCSRPSSASSSATSRRGVRRAWIRSRRCGTSRRRSGRHHLWQALVARPGQATGDAEPSPLQVRPHPATTER